MKKTYEEPKAEALEFNYTDTVVASGEVVNKNPKKGCTVTPSGTTPHNVNQCGEGAPTNNNNC